MKLRLKVWRQSGRDHPGRFEEYDLEGLNPDMSFLEMMDVLNDRLTREGKEPVAFEHDCREGICGSCAMAINGEPHGPNEGATTCQVYLRSFKDWSIDRILPDAVKAWGQGKPLVVRNPGATRPWQHVLEPLSAYICLTLVS